MANIPVLGLSTHKQRVCSLYKRMLRNLDSWYYFRDQYRYEAVLLRARFDQHKNETDMRRAKNLMEQGEEELFKYQHPAPKQFPNSPKGVAYGRVVTPPDWILDTWHPLEKKAYPEYFKRREERKKEFVIWWEKNYGSGREDKKLVDRPSSD